MWLFDIFTYEYEFWNKLKKILDWVGIKNYKNKLTDSDYTNIILHIEKNYNIHNDKCINSIYKIMKKCLNEKRYISLFDCWLMELYLESADMNGINLNINLNTEFKILGKIFKN